MVPALDEPPGTLPPGPQTLTQSEHEASAAGPLPRSGTDLVPNEPSLVQRWPMRSAGEPENISSSTSGPGSSTLSGRAPIGPIGRAEVQRRTAGPVEEPAPVSPTEPVLPTPAAAGSEALEKRPFRLRVGAPINPSPEPQVEGVDGGLAPASDTTATHRPAPGAVAPDWQTTEATEPLAQMPPLPAVRPHLQRSARESHGTAPTLGSSPPTDVGDGPEPAEELSWLDTGVDEVPYLPGENDPLVHKGQPSPEVEEVWTSDLPPMSRAPGAGVSQTDGDQYAYSEELTGEADSPEADGPETTPVLGAGETVQTMSIFDHPRDDTPESPGPDAPPVDAIYRPATPVPEVTGTVSLLGSADFAPLDEASPASTSPNAASDESQITVAKGESGHTATSGPGPFSSQGARPGLGSVPAPDVQRLTASQSPTFATPIPSRVSQSTPSAPLGPTHQIHDSNLPFGPPLEQAQPPARSVGALEPEPARGEPATQDQATTADNLTAAPEAASPETALLVGRHLHELVVARNPWVSASPVTVDGPVHLPVPVEVQRQGLLSATGSSLSRDLSLPQMPFQPGASSNPEVSRSAARPASTVVRSSNSQVQRLVDRDPNNLAPPLPVATPAQSLTFGPSAGQGSGPSPLSLPQRVVFSAPSVASPTAEDGNQCRFAPPSGGRPGYSTDHQRATRRRWPGRAGVRGGGRSRPDGSPRTRERQWRWCSPWW